MKDIVLLPNLTKDPQLRVTSQIAQLLCGRANVYLQEELAHFSLPSVKYKPFCTLFSEADCVIALGGDATLLSAAKQASFSGTPVLGINLGRLGFLAEIEVADISTSLNKLLNDEYNLEKRMMLDAVLTKKSGDTASFLALNDVVCTRSGGLGLVNLDVHIDKEFMDDFKADGLIVATPTGSTAYSLSAGGPVVEPSIESFIITPICPHKLYSKTIIIPAKSEIRISLNESNAKTALITADGESDMIFDKGDTLTISRSKNSSTLIKINGNNFYSILHEKLLGKEQ